MSRLVAPLCSGPFICCHVCCSLLELLLRQLELLLLLAEELECCGVARRELCLLRRHLAQPQQLGLCGLALALLARALHRQRLQLALLRG